VAIDNDCVMALLAQRPYGRYRPEPSWLPSAALLEASYKAYRPVALAFGLFCILRLIGSNSRVFAKKSNFREVF
jgi:hypothetical protein